MDAARFLVEIITPRGVQLEDEAESLSAMASDGSIGILYNHAPLITRIAEGDLKLCKGRGEKIIKVKEGFMEVKKNKVTILTKEVILPDL